MLVCSQESPLRYALISTPLTGYKKRRFRLLRAFSRVLAAGILAALGLTAYVDWQVSSALLHPAPFARPDMPSHYGLAYRSVDIPSPRVTRPLKGWLFENPHADGRAVLFLHGWRSHKQHMLKDYLSWLARHYTVLAFDHPNHGESPEGPTTLGDLERIDAKAALGLLRQRGYKRLGVMGVSMGGTTAIGLAAQTKDLRAVVSEGTFATPPEASFGYFQGKGFWLPDWLSVTTAGMLSARAGRNLWEASAERQIARLAPRPVLLIHGSKDTVVLPGNAQRLYGLAKGPKELWFVPGADHVSDPDAGPHALRPAEYERRVTAFFDRTL